MKRSLTSSSLSDGSLPVRFLLSLCLLAFCCVVPSASFAQRSPTDSDPDDQAVEPGGLAYGTYAERQRATLEMWRRRESSRQAVQDAAQNADPEVAERAEWILRQWRSGALPGERQDPLGPLLSINNPSALNDILERGGFRQVLVAVEESEDTVDYQNTQARVARALTIRFPIYVERAINDQSEADLLALLDAVAVDRSVASAWNDFRSVLGDGDASGRELPTAAEQWPQPAIDLFRSQQAMVAGDFAGSIRFAERANDQEFLRNARMLAGQWKRLGQQSLQRAKEAATPVEQAEAYAWALAGADRSDDAETTKAATDALLESGEAETAELQNLAQLIRWHALAIHADIDSAIDVIAETDSHAAADVAITASRLERAFELIPLPVDELPSQLDSWCEEAFAAQAELPAGKIADEIKDLSTLARLLLHIGDTQAAHEIYRRLAVAHIIVGYSNQTLKEWTIAELLSRNRTEWSIEFAVDKNDRSITKRNLDLVAYGLGVNYRTVSLVIEKLKVLNPRASFQKRFRDACDLFLGTVPDGMDPDQDFPKLYDLLVSQQEISRAGGRSVQMTRVALDFDTIEMFANLGQMELAREGLSALALSGDIEAKTRVAELELHQDQHGKADALWFDVADSAKSRATVSIDHGLAFAKASVGRWILAKRSGHEQRAEKLEYQIRLMLCSPSLRFRKDLANYLLENHQYSLAAETLRDLVVKVAFGEPGVPDLFYTARSYAAALAAFQESAPDAFSVSGFDPQDIPKWSDLSVLAILRVDRFPDTLYVGLPLAVRKSYLQHAIDTRNGTLAQQAIADIERLDWLNIDYAERLLPEVRKAGLASIADEAFDRLMEKGRVHTQRFGLDSTALNNLAWTAAMNARGLEEALTLSQRAVDLEPDSVIFRDTLAEVLHLLGRTREALQIESACLLDQPDEWHLHQQINKYQSVLAGQDN